MMNTLSAASVGIAAVFVILCLRAQQKEIAALIGISAGIILYSASISRMSGVLGEIAEMTEDREIRACAKTLVKALGLSTAAQITAEICREAGEAGIGSRVETAAKIEIVLLALPLAGELLKMAEELMG